MKRIIKSIVLVLLMTGPALAEPNPIQIQMDERYHSRQHPEPIAVPSDILAAFKVTAQKNYSNATAQADHVSYLETCWKRLQLYKSVGAEGVPMERMKKLVAKAEEKAAGNPGMALVYVRKYVDAVRAVQEFE